MYQTIDRFEVKRLMQEGVPLLDVLPSELYDQEHITGAVSVPLKTLEKRVDGWERNRPLIVYCNDAV